MRGTYVFNPGLALKVEEDWINIYDLLVIKKPSLTLPFDHPIDQS